MTKNLEKVEKIEVPPLDKSTIALETQHDSSFGVGGNIDDESGFDRSSDSEIFDSYSSNSAVHL